MNKKKLKRREEKAENNKKKRSKSYTKKEKPKKLGRMVAPVHFDPKILPKGSAKLPWARGAQRPVWHVSKPNLAGARSTLARTRGQNPLV